MRGNTHYSFTGCIPSWQHVFLLKCAYLFCRLLVTTIALRTNIQNYFIPVITVLLAGTPLQNNLDELFMLMHFLDAGMFSNLEESQVKFKDINQEEQIVRIHKRLAPHLLRSTIVQI
ncbi:hypothetical protein MKX03_020396 [Papaver bracteatum]|nr:hypothetical protein MKX03_020396 [Papaver bracteatum]